MKCKKCKSEWSSSKVPQICPFCGESLVQLNAKTPEQVLSFIMDEYGVDVFKNKKLLLSYFSDYAPFLVKEYKLLKNGCSTDFLNILLMSDSSTKDLREIAINKSVGMLMDECFMSEEYARQVIGWIVFALNWDVNNLDIQKENFQIIKSENNCDKKIFRGEYNCLNNVRVFDIIDAVDLDNDKAGIKANQLSNLIKMEIPVPQGIIINAKENTNFFENTSKLSNELKIDIKTGIQKIEKITGRKFGCEFKPLILSLSVSPTVKMSGLMDEIVCIGFNTKVTETFAIFIDEEWAWSTYCQFIVRFMSQVSEIPKTCIQNTINGYKTSNNISTDNTNLSGKDYKQIAFLLLSKYKEWKMVDFPQDAYEQLFLSIEATYRRWFAPEASTYRKNKGIPFVAGQAICIQEMVFGNMSEKSGVGRIYMSDESKKIYIPKSLSINRSYDFGLNTVTCLSQLPESLDTVIDAIIKSIQDKYGDDISLVYTIEDSDKIYINSIETL